MQGKLGGYIFRAFISFAAITPSLRSMHEQEQVIQVLCAAFAANKSVNAVINQDKPGERMQALMDYCYKVSKRRQGVRLSEDGSGVMLSYDPVTQPMKLADHLDSLSLIKNAIGWGRALSINKRETFIKKHHPQTPFIYLLFLGVHPDHQGKGVGSQLLMHLIAQSKKEGKPIYLETSHPPNLPFYRKFGFEVFDAWQIREDYTVWFMKWDV
jgi:GNAT superfamily N-acetyltransferase